MNEPAITPELVAQHHLTLRELQNILEVLGHVVTNITRAPVVMQAGEESVDPCESLETQVFGLDDIADTQDAGGDLRKLLATPAIAATRGDDRRDKDGTDGGFVVCPGSDAVVIRFQRNGLPDAGADDAVQPAVSDGSGAEALPDKFVAVAVAGHRGQGALDPLESDTAANAEAGRRLACTGAVSVGSINLGQSHGPTPTVAVVGIIDEPAHLTTRCFKDEGDAIILLGGPVDTADPLQGLGGSAYLTPIHGQKNGLSPRVDLEAAKTLHTTLLGLIHEGVVKSAHGCGAGGLSVALAESCFSNQIAKETFQFLGAAVDLSAVAGTRLDALLFGETQNRVVISVAATDAGRVVKQAQIMGVPAAVIGKVGGAALSVKTAAGEFTAPIAELHDAWWNSIARAMA